MHTLIVFEEGHDVASEHSIHVLVLQMSKSTLLCLMMSPSTIKLPQPHRPFCTTNIYVTFSAMRPYTQVTICVSQVIPWFIWEQDTMPMSVTYWPSRKQWFWCHHRFIHVCLLQWQQFKQLAKSDHGSTDKWCKFCEVIVAHWYLVHQPSLLDSSCWK